MGCEVEPAPFRNHHDPEWREKMGAEPDGILHTESGPRLLEIKCPYRDLTWEQVPPDYIAQVQFQMDVWDVKSADIIAYFQASSSLKIFRIYRQFILESHN